MDKLYIHIYTYGKKYDYFVNKEIDKNYLYNEIKKYFRSKKCFLLDKLKELIGKENLIDISEIEIEKLDENYNLLNIFEFSKYTKIDLIYYNNYKSYLLETDKILTEKIEGNCVDDFIERICHPLEYKLNKYLDNLSYRKNERLKENKYHSSACYEQDFSQILKIKEICDKLSCLCNKELEKLSDKYTKS